MGKRVIRIVDDDMSMAHRCASFLSITFTSVEVVVATALWTALLTADQKKPDLVYADLWAKGGSNSGMDIIRHLRQRYPHLKIVLLTGEWDDRIIQAAMQAGASDLILKPLTAAQMREKTEQFLAELDQS